MDIIEIDGSEGEGGGQIIRSAIGLSMATGRPFRISRIRGKRKRPGLLRQHLTAVEAAAKICGADVTGAALKSVELEFVPGRPRGGDYHFAVGTAGSAILVLQAILPGLLMSGEASTVRIEGGTHNAWAPPFDFLEQTFLPQLRTMGIEVTARLERYGFYPAGGGSLAVTVAPPQSPESRRIVPLALLDRGESGPVTARILLAGLPRTIGEKQEQILRSRLDLAPDAVEHMDVESLGPGNAILIRVPFESGVEIVSAFGEVGVGSRAVLKKPLEHVRRLVSSTAAVGEFLADQLLLPMALGPGGSFRTHTVSRHAHTNANVIRQFLNVEIDFQEEDRNCHLVTVTSGGLLS